MVARVTMAEIDAVRMRVETAVELFRESVLPALREQEGYEWTYLLLSREGKALALTFWATEEDAERSGRSGFYNEQVEKFGTIYRGPPGRETYDVVVAEAPDVAFA